MRSQRQQVGRYASSPRYVPRACSRRGTTQRHGRVVSTTEVSEIASESDVSVVSFAPPELVSPTPGMLSSADEITPLSDGVELSSLLQLIMTVEATRARPAMA